MFKKTGIPVEPFPAGRTVSGYRARGHTGKQTYFV
jgi:hypothetical protein